MKKLYFERSNRRKLFLSEVADQSKALAAIYKFLDEHNYKRYYTRMWTDEDGVQHYDVGSHSEFFLLYPEGAEPDESEVDYE